MPQNNQQQHAAGATTVLYNRCTRPSPNQLYAVEAGRQRFASAAFCLFCFSLPTPRQSLPSQLLPLQLLLLSSVPPVYGLSGGITMTRRILQHALRLLAACYSTAGCSSRRTFQTMYQGQSLSRYTSRMSATRRSEFHRWSGNVQVSHQSSG